MGWNEKWLCSNVSWDSHIITHFCISVKLAEGRMTKKELLRQLKNIPDDAVVAYFNGNEEVSIASKVLIHNPEDPYFYQPVNMRKPRLWITLGEAD